MRSAYGQFDLGTRKVLGRIPDRSRGGQRQRDTPVLIWASVLVAVAASTGTGHATAVVCPPSGARILLREGSTSVYRTKTGETRACRRGDRDILLANATDELISLPPAMSIAGGRLAYGLYYNDVNDLSATTVEAVDLRRGKGARRPRSYSASGIYDPARVVRTVAQSNGTVVWSACASHAPPSTTPFEARRCPKSAGDGTHPVAEIRIGYTNGRSRTLDASNTIDPRSIGVRDGRVVWQRGSKTRSFKP